MNKNTYIILLILISTFTVSCNFECGVDKVQVLNNLSNYQSVIGYRSNCGATSPYTINVSFIRPEMNIQKERGEIFRATHASDLEIIKISQDSVKIIFGAGEKDIVTQIDSLYGIKFIYKNKWLKEK